VEGAVPAPGATDVALRPASTADSEFCYRLHQAAMGEYVTALFGWDEQVQRDYQDRAFNPASWQIITVAGADAGMIDVERRADEIMLSRIEILPAYQGRGIGTRLIGALIAEAHRQGQALVLEVFAINRRPGPSTSGSACGKRLSTARATSRSPCGPRRQSKQLRAGPRLLGLRLVLLAGL
jgi:GNAT superfamily N-acetyltransferase